MLIQPSSAAAERAFSLLASSFNERQTSDLEDYVQTCQHPVTTFFHVLATCTSYNILKFQHLLHCPMF
jgi:hypothetical protein